ncbi:hypothetical protein pkur_cds_854 [Pandoravirus kuranda]|uniref:Uncharacterized protein n=1 Tax=Pandoravirus kuranda TaxID=3019033 RepID=A0AA95J4S1_9VIRU|nr:hypothetical protein pkur_cds_854 [Pandoravirus kuranda]
MDQHDEAAQKPEEAVADNGGGDGNDDDEYIDIRMRVPKALAKDLLCEMMSEYSEATCCATWGGDIDIDIDANARKRLGPGGDVVHCSRDMLNVALAQIHRHCGGWWSDRVPHADQQRNQGKGFSLAFYPLDEWTALPVPRWMRDRVAYPNPAIEDNSSEESETDSGSSEDKEAKDRAWWQWRDSMQEANAAPIDPLSAAVPTATAATDTTVCAPEGGSAHAAP